MGTNKSFRPYRLRFSSYKKDNFKNIWNQLEKSGRALSEPKTSKEFKKYLKSLVVDTSNFEIYHKHSKNRSTIILKPGFKLIRTPKNRLRVIRDNDYFL